MATENHSTNSEKPSRRGLLQLFAAAPAVVATSAIAAPAVLPAVIAAAEPAVAAPTITSTIATMAATYQSGTGSPLSPFMILDMFKNAGWDINQRIAEKYDLKWEAIENFLKAYDDFIQADELPCNASNNTYSTILSRQMSLEAAWNNPTFQAAVREYCATLKAEYAALATSEYTTLLDTHKETLNALHKNRDSILDVKVPAELVENPDSFTTRMQSFKKALEEAVASSKDHRSWSKNTLYNSLDGSNDLQLDGYSIFNRKNHRDGCQGSIADALPPNMQVIRQQALLELLLHENIALASSYNWITDPHNFKVTCADYSPHSLKITPHAYGWRMPDGYHAQLLPTKQAALKHYNTLAREMARRYLIAHPFSTERLNTEFHTQLLQESPEYVAGNHMSPQAREQLLTGIDGCLDAICNATSEVNLLARYATLASTTAVNSIGLLEKYIASTAPEAVSIDPETHQLSITDATLREQVEAERAVLEAAAETTNDANAAHTDDAKGHHTATQSARKAARGKGGAREA